MKRSLFRIFTVLGLMGMILSACGATAASQEGPVVIGFTSSLTGAQEVSSKRQVAGFNLWMEQVNEAGGI